ncbi:hypothetical protein EOW77_0013560 [Bradyrhizobium yuanmingense]|nr:hypothetical protein EOW77_0013560 [Bradyrhizobium yuanmingense]
MSQASGSFFLCVAPNRGRHARACPGHSRASCVEQGVDGRVKPGHDDAARSTHQAHDLLSAMRATVAS